MQLRNLIKLVGTLLANESLGNVTLTDGEYDKLTDDQIYADTNAHVLMVGAATASLVSPIAWEPSNTIHANYLSLGPVERADLIDEDTENNAYDLHTAAANFTGVQFDLSPAISATRVNFYTQAPTWSIDTPRSADKCLFGTTTAANASRQATDATAVFGSSGLWLPQNTAIGGTCDEWIWKDAGSFVALSGMEIEATNVLGILIQYWTGTSNPSSADLNGTSGWTDISLRDTMLMFTGNFYYMPGTSSSIDSKHQCVFQNTIRARYWKFNFRFRNDLKLHDYTANSDLFRMWTRTVGGDNEDSGNTYMFPESYFQLVNGCRLAGIASMSNMIVGNGSTSYTASVKLKIGRLTGTYDWFVYDAGSVTVDDSRTGRSCGVLNYSYLSSAYFVPNDGNTYYMGHYLASGTFTKAKYTGVGIRHAKSGDVNGSVAACTPQTNSAIIMPLQLPKISVTSIRGISASGAVIAYQDNLDTWHGSSGVEKPRTQYSATFPIQTLDTDNFDYLHSTHMQIESVNNLIALGPTTTDLSTAEYAEIAAKNSFANTGVRELVFDVALGRSGTPQGYLYAGIHTFNNIDPSRDINGARDTSGLYITIGENGYIEIITATSTSVITSLLNKSRHANINCIRDDSGASLSAQPFTQIKLRINFNNKSFSVSIANIIIYQGVIDNTTFTDMGSTLGWSISNAAKWYVFDGNGANNSKTSVLTPPFWDTNTGLWSVSVDSGSNPYRLFNRSISGTQWYGTTTDYSTPATIMLTSPDVIYPNKYRIGSVAQAQQNIRAFPKSWTIGFPTVSTPSRTNDAHWTTVHSVTDAADPGSGAWSSYFTFTITGGTKYLRMKITDAYNKDSAYNGPGIAEWEIIGTDAPILYTIPSISEATTLIKNIFCNWSGAADDDWLVISELDTDIRHDTTSYTVKANNLRITEGDPKYRASNQGMHDISSYFDGYPCIHKGRTAQHYLDGIKNDSVNSYIMPHPGQDLLLAAHLDEIELISGAYLVHLETKHLPSKFEMYLYGAESTEVYWSDARTWSDVETRFGNDFAGQWGYVTFWGKFDKPSFHGGIMSGYGPIDSQFAWPFYKFSTSWDYKTNPSGVHGWSYINTGSGAVTTAQSNYSSSGCLVLNAAVSDANILRPRGIFYQRPLPDFANGEKLHVGFKMCGTSARRDNSGDASGNLIGFWDANNDYRAVMAGPNYYYSHGRNFTWGSARYYDTFCVRAAGDYSNTRDQNTSDGWMFQQGSDYIIDGSVICGGWTGLSMRWDTATTLSMYNLVDGCRPEFYKNDWNGWNVLPYFSSSIYVGLWAKPHNEYVSSFTMFEGWNVPSEWPLTEFREYNAIKSIGLAGCWGNSKSFTFNISDIEEDSYYLWAYVAGIQSTGDTEVGSIAISGLMGSYTINSASPYDGAWVQIGDGTFNINSGSVFTFSPTNLYGKNSWTRTTAIKGICATKTAGPPSSAWVPRGYLGNAERCRASYSDPNVAKVADARESLTSFGAKSQNGATPTLLSLKSNTPQYTKLIELASIISPEDDTENKIVKHTFDYYYDFHARHTEGIPYNGLELLGESYLCHPAYINPTQGLVINSQCHTTANTRPTGIYSAAFEFGDGFWCEAEVLGSGGVGGYQPIISVVSAVNSLNVDHIGATINRASDSSWSLATWVSSTYNSYYPGTQATASAPAYLRLSYHGESYADTNWWFEWLDSDHRIMDYIQVISGRVPTIAPGTPIRVGVGMGGVYKAWYSFVRYGYMKINPGSGGHTPHGFDDNARTNDLIINSFVPIKVDFPLSVKTLRVEHHSTSLWTDSTSDVIIGGREIEIEYMQVPQLVLDFDADDSYVINSIKYYTDDNQVMSDVTIEYGASFESLSAPTLQQMIGGVSVDVNTMAQCFRITHTLGRYNTAVIHARQMIVEQASGKVQFGVIGVDTSDTIADAPMGDLSAVTRLYVYNNDNGTKTAGVFIPNTRFGQWVEISADGVTWVGQGESITLSDIPAHESAPFYVRSNVPIDASEAPENISRLIYARWLI